MSDLAGLVEKVAGGGCASDSERLAAQRELCTLLAPRLHLYGLRHLQDDAAAADLVQDALVVLVEAMRAGVVATFQEERSAELLVRYWAEDVDADELDAVEEHVCGCSDCFEASARVGAFVRGGGEARDTYTARHRLGVSS